MSRPAPSKVQLHELREAVREVAWQHARTKAGLHVGDPPRTPFDADALDADGQRAAVLAQLAALREVGEQAERLISLTVTVAGDTGAGGEQIGQALGVTRSAVRKAWPEAVAGSPGPRRATFTTTHSDIWPDTAPQPDREQLARIEAQLTDDVLSEEDLPAALHAAGLPELARVLRQLTGYGTR